MALPHPGRILVVDDETPILELVRGYLERDGFEVDTASDGPAGRAAVRAGNPDAVVLDVMLPGLDGICMSCANRITRALRKLDGVERVRVDLVQETATVRRDATVVSDVSLATAIAAAGYEADLGSAVAVSNADRPGFVARLAARLRS